MDQIVKVEPLEPEDGENSDDDVSDLIRRAELIIEENRERLRRSLRVDAEAVRARAMEMLREPSPVLNIDESIDNSALPAEILPEPQANNCSCSEEDKDDDVIIVDTFQLPQSLEIINLNTPEYTPPKRRRRRNVANQVIDDVVTVIDTSTNSFENEGPSTEPNLSSSSSSNSGQASNSLSINCPICLDNCRKPTATLCGHIYCEKCIKAAIHSTKKCPLCKRKLAAKSIHPLYFN